MSKTIYYIELKRLGQAPSKFKFAIDNTKKVIRDIKQELKGRLVQKKAIEDTHEIILRDKQLFELCSDDEIDDVVIEADKNIIVSVKLQEAQLLGLLVHNQTSQFKLQIFILYLL
jgi:hypothetical protein